MRYLLSLEVTQANVIKAESRKKLERERNRVRLEQVRSDKDVIFSI